VEYLIQEYCPDTGKVLYSKRFDNSQSGIAFSDFEKYTKGYVVLYRKEAGKFLTIASKKV
jgi:hypothetical protein